MIERHVIYKTLRRVERQLAVPLVAACLYEAAALTFRSKHTPPITKLAHEHKALLVLVCGAITVHVWFYEPSDG